MSYYDTDYGAPAEDGRAWSPEWGAYWEELLDHDRDDDKDVVIGHYVALPHQCSEWKIGGVEAVRRLIADLERLVAEGPPT